MSVIDIHVEAKHLAEERRRILRKVQGIIGAASIAQPHIEQAIGTEGQVAAVVSAERLLNGSRSVGPPQVEPRCGIELERGCHRSREASDHRRPIAVREMHEHAATAIGGDRHPEQPALNLRVHLVAQIKEGFGLDHAAENHADESPTFDHVRRIERRIGHDSNRFVEARSDTHRAELRLRVSDAN